MDVRDHRATAGREDRLEDDRGRGQERRRRHIRARRWGQTRVNVQMDVEGESTAENVAGDLLGVVKRQVRGDLERFKQLIENRDDETGAWRGEVREGETT